MRDEQLVKALCYGYLPEERALALIEAEKARHQEKLASYEEFERGLEALYGEGGISREAYLGTLLTLRRGIGVEKSYVEWCEEAGGSSRDRNGRIQGGLMLGLPRPKTGAGESRAGGRRR